MPNFFIDKFRIPPFLLPIYQAAGMQYGIRWEILAGINEIETDYGRNLNVSSAGAVGWMQFMPATWKSYGVDANQDGVKDPFNPVDAIFAAARYLKAAGGDKDLRKGIFAYNHADWYVDSVLMRAQVIGGIPGDLVGSLTGLTQGRFPVRAKATYAGALKKADTQDQGRQRRRHRRVRQDAPQHRDLRQGRLPGDRRQRRQGPQASAPSKRLGRYVIVQDVYGNTYTYGHLAASPRPTRAPSAARRRPTGRQAPRPRRRRDHRARDQGRRQGRQGAKAAEPAEPTRRTPPRRPRSACSPTRSASTRSPTAATPRSAAPARSRPPPALRSASTPRTSSPSGSSRAPASSAAPRSAASARPTRSAPHLLFEIRPAGRGAPRIDPKPILDGWKLLESTEVYRAKGKNALFGADADAS